MEKQNPLTIYTLDKIKEKTTNEVPIRKGCPNHQCFCTGACQEIIGWREKTEEEKRTIHPPQF